VIHYKSLVVFALLSEMWSMMGLSLEQIDVLK
jgi:hypothetical protein